MDVGAADVEVAPLAAAIGEPVRARMLYCLIDGRARTSTELAIIGGLTPPRLAFIFSGCDRGGWSRCRPG